MPILGKRFHRLTLPSMLPSAVTTPKNICQKKKSTSEEILLFQIDAINRQNKLFVSYNFLRHSTIKNGKKVALYLGSHQNLPIIVFFKNFVL